MQEKMLQASLPLLSSVIRPGRVGLAAAAMLLDKRLNSATIRTQSLACFRQSFIAVRGALGASPGRLVRQFVTEGLVLVAAGSVLGFAAALVPMRLLIRLVPADMLDQMPYLQGLSFNPRVLAFAASVSLFAVLLFSIAPTLRLSRNEAQAGLIAGFAALALLLGAVGLYGVVAYSVSQRTREIGIRMALGAQRSSVYGIVMRQAGWLTLAGLGIGLVCSVCASMLMHKLLFGVRAWDPMTLTGVALLLGLVSMAASFLPARRAASVNPADALRAE
jgi:ABC-type antimicrobial peptide transport system permease subunit